MVTYYSVEFMTRYRMEYERIVSWWIEMRIAGLTYFPPGSGWTGEECLLPLCHDRETY